MSLFSVALEDGVVGIDAAVAEERPAPAHILSAVKVNIDDFVFLVLGIELCKLYKIANGLARENYSDELINGIFFDNANAFIVANM